MPPEDNRFNLGCLTFVFLVFGLVNIVPSIIALKHGTMVWFGRYIKIQVSPWFTLIFGCMFLVVGIAGIYKLYKDKDKYPF
jgi:hypothetical protein